MKKHPLSASTHLIKCKEGKRKVKRVRNVFQRLPTNMLVTWINRAKASKHPMVAETVEELDAELDKRDYRRKYGIRWLKQLPKNLEKV